MILGHFETQNNNYAGHLVVHLYTNILKHPNVTCIFLINDLTSIFQCFV